ncbi:TMEM143 family protein [Nocardia sp. NPDC052001]|uniref:TMEM143 family protein n=1 Tax=Nocardia sp. NPDC052001 TaxID=3154853 RepID=UPI0034440D9A
MEAEHFLPFRKSAVIALCAEEVPAKERESFLEFARLLAALVHHRYHVRGDGLLDAYQVLDPAADERAVHSATTTDYIVAQQILERELVELAEAADFTRIDTAEIRRAFAEHSLVKVRLAVDDQDLDAALFFRRGVAERTEQVKWLFGLRRRAVEFTCYSKVLVYIPRLGGEVVLKLFRDVPRNDLEMLYPDARVGMRPLDKLLIGVPAMISGIIVIATKLIAALAPVLLLLAFWAGLRQESVRLDQTALISLAAGTGAFGGYLFRQFSKFKNRKIKLLKTLSEHLYFRNLDNGAGVFHHLLDAAEDADLKQMLLTYHFLNTTPHPLTPADLDTQIESWFHSRWNTTFDFEARAGIQALQSLNLLTEPHPGTYTAIPLPAAITHLDAHWDNIFRPPTSGKRKTGAAPTQDHTG